MRAWNRLTDLFIVIQKIVAGPRDGRSDTGGNGRDREEDSLRKS